MYTIDDPLSAAPLTSGFDSKSVKQPPRPFSVFDNNSLEEAWLGLGSEKDRKNHNKSKSRKTSCPPQKNRYVSNVRTLAPAVKQKNHSAEERSMTNSDAKVSASRVSEQTVSESSIALRYPVNESSRENVSKSAVPCSRDHERCRSKPGQCDCVYCPKAPIIKASPHYEDLTPSTKRSGKSKETSCCPGTFDNQPRALPGDTSNAGTDYEAHLENKGEGDSHNVRDEDLNQTSVASLNCELGECQGDGTTSTLVSKVSRSFKEQNASHSPAMSFKDHNKRENSKESQAFAKYSQGIYCDSENSWPTVRKQKEPGEDARPSTPSDSTNRQDHASNAGTTGRPFLKLPSRPTTPQSASSKIGSPHKGENSDTFVDPLADTSDVSRRRGGRDSIKTEAVLDHKCKAYINTKDNVDIPVGVSRLHKVCLPALQMEPIYWSPIHDIASVTRGTWFYKETMFPVEPALANQLEMGYRELRPWSQTWRDEVRSAREVGVAGEEKVLHRLWPKDEEICIDDILSTESYCAAGFCKGGATAEGVADGDISNNKLPDPKQIVKKFLDCRIIYKDFRDAFILKPNQQPSAYHNRRPLLKISSGFEVGIPVRRGFDWRAWERLHPSKKNNVTIKAEEQAAVSGDTGFAKRDACPACRSQEQRKECTDLCLVIHGIGQKLSERVESFHFTHAINAFRRSVNVEFGNEGVQRVCRDDFGGVMVLPVNWRSNVSFDDDKSSRNGYNDNSACDFTLEDITIPSIPAVRSMISDVMLDVPYYMSKNKDRMIDAVISEANRVYRLWCKNNLEFSKKGRVHLLAHSLGSVMAMEVLSSQPTLVPQIDLQEKRPNRKHLEFNTTNLFCLGSPAGLFCLLEKRKLMPRRGQNKPGAEIGDSTDRSIVGEQGTFGCLAVENIYNIMNINDPIACRLNPCADPHYAASLKTAHVPSATVGFFESLSNAMRVVTPGSTAPTRLAVGQISKPTIAPRKPSQLEMETHDWTEEERQEKKFYLLNDNGQIDYCLGSGGGPLEYQYLNMLGAHSAYWASIDVVRMLATEIGRAPGKANCLPNMKAVKIRRKS
jgi:hypothetical protein